MLNAVRDNPSACGVHRLQHAARCAFAFIISGFFAGISGGLGALNFEIVTAEVVGAARPGAYLLFTFLGGATFFFGPIIGAVLMVLAFMLLSEFTSAWLLCTWAWVFLFMVMYAPGGIASLIMMNLRVAALRQTAPPLDHVPGHSGGHGLVGCWACGHDRDDLPPAAQLCRPGPQMSFLGATLTRRPTAGSARCSCC